MHVNHKGMKDRSFDLHMKCTGQSVWEGMKSLLLVSNDVLDGV